MGGLALNKSLTERLLRKFHLFHVGGFGWMGEKI